jgi:hypothetical protein
MILNIGGAQMASREMGRGEYSAIQLHDSVIVLASGLAPTPGYVVWLQQVRNEIDFVLYWVAPEGIQPELETPFEVRAAFTESAVVKVVHVQDRDGNHDVHVVQKKGFYS